MPEVHTRRIFVALLDQGEGAWREVRAVSEGGDIYRIVSHNDNPAEKWEYITGERVRCRAMTLDRGERVLVATQRVQPED